MKQPIKSTSFGRLNLWLGVLRYPTHTLEQEKPRSNYEEASKHLFVAFILVTVLDVLLALGSDIFNILLNDTLLVVIVIPFNTTVVFFLAKLFGGKGSFRQHFYIFSIIFSPIIVLASTLSTLSFVVGLDGLIGSMPLLRYFLFLVCVIVLQIIALKVVHKFGTLRAIFVILILIALSVLLVVLPQAILGMLLARISPPATCDSYYSIIQTLDEASNHPGTPIRLRNCMLGSEDIITAQEYREGASLTNKTLVIVCGVGTSGGCTDGIYPTTVGTEVISELNQDQSVVQYWAEASVYSNQIGQLGPVTIIMPVQFEVYCGETYCRITAMAG